MLQIHNVNLQIKPRDSETMYFKALQYHSSGIQIFVEMTFHTHRELRHSDISFDGLLFANQSMHFIWLLQPLLDFLPHLIICLSFLTFHPMIWFLTLLWCSRRNSWLPGFYVGTFAKLRKVSIRSLMLVCLSVHFVYQSAWNNSVLTGIFFMKFDIWLFSKIFRKNSSLNRIW